MIQVKLEDIIEQIEMANDLHYCYLNIKTGEIHLIPEEIDMYLEDDEFDEEELSDWEKVAYRIAKEIEEKPDDYISLPGKYERNDYQVMERFSLSLTENKIRKEIYNSIKSKEAFRRFKEEIGKYELVEEWNKYKNDSIKEIAIDWCKRNNINFI